MFNDYIEQFLQSDNKHLDKIFSDVRIRDNRKIQPEIGLPVGKFIGLIIRTIDAKRVQEFGTCLGYSTIWIAEALKHTKGKLTAIELESELFAETKRNVKQAGLENIVELIQGDASVIIDKLEPPFDLILQDSDKPLYPVMLEKCINLVRKNGLLLADDALLKPMKVQKELSKPLHRYNEMVFADKRLYSTILPIGDGLTVSVKMED